MWNTYKTRESAESYLKGEGFKFNPDSGMFERGERYVSFARAIVGQCADGIFIITRA